MNLFVWSIYGLGDSRHQHSGRIISLIFELSGLFVLVSFYTYTGAFDFESLILDSSLLFAGIALGRAMVWHVFRHAKLTKATRFLAGSIPAATLALFITSTFTQPHLPLFLDQPT